MSKYKMMASELAADADSDARDMSEDELKTFIGGIPFRYMQDVKLLCNYLAEKKVSKTDYYIVLNFVNNNRNFIRDVKVITDITYNEVLKDFDLAVTNTIIIHRINYVLLQSMLEVYNNLNDNKRLTLSNKRMWDKAMGVWKGYYQRRKDNIEETAWYTLQDHLRLANNALSPYIDKVYVSVRDNMISLGMRDVEVKARCVVALYLGKVMIHSYNALFRDFGKETYVDFSKCFRDELLTEMVRHFASFCDTIGLKTKANKDGSYDVKDYDPEKYIRFTWAWNDLIAAFRNDDLMDESARKAIELNPNVQRDYERILQEEERKQNDEVADKLEGKFKVSRF